MALVILTFAVAISAPVIASRTASYHQQGHIHVNNGSSAGLSVSPTFLEFGNVTFGQLSQQQITVTNTGNCTENLAVNYTTTPGFSISILNYTGLKPTGILAITASFDHNKPTPGTDNTFALDWTCTCS